MALDKEKILNELGNVVNQLKSADCGCMGKLFSNSNQSNPNAMGNPGSDGCMRGCCHGYGCGHGCHGSNAPGAGEPYSGNTCMGRCNPPKLYADTYNYLNHSLMQPMVKEVYDDLKSLTPANTVVNNPMAAQMGLSQVNNPGAGMRGQMGNMAQNQMPGGAMGNSNNQQQMSPPMGQMGQPTMQMGQPMRRTGQPMTGMGGMGPDIVNMMMGDTSAKMSNKPNQGGANVGLEGNNAPQSPEMGMANVRGDFGQGQYNAGMPGNNAGQYNSGNMGMNNMNPTQQYMTQPNMYAGANTNVQGNAMNSNMSQMNPGSQQMRTMGASPAQPQMNARNPYGQHEAGVTTFNKMFPGVTTGELGFDPMAIAIQMNPANQQRAAMDSMQKMLMSNGREALMQPVINATNAAAANIAQANQPPMNQAPVQQNLPPGGNAAAVPIQSNQVPQQQVYTALTGAPSMNQQQIPIQPQQYQQQIPTQQQQYQQQIPTQQQQYQQQNLQYQLQQNQNLNTGALPTVYEGSGDPNARQEGSPPNPAAQQMIKEPIFPADTSRNLPPAHMNLKPQKYNTLGQPVEMLPAEAYRFEEPSLPQTLSPQPTPSRIRADQARYSNVKNTVSKTSLAGNRPVGRTPSRGQLQQIYNQYKGSQSYTQQNIKPSGNGGSYSEGRLNIPQANVVRRAPIERVGGDTLASNTMNHPVGQKVEQMPGQVGDVPTGDKPIGYNEQIPVKPSNVRNGLQDQTYTSYVTTAAWSFHGATPAPYSNGYRFRNKP